jgi:hypothetical protein
MPQALKEADNVQVFDDFLWMISPHLWTTVLTDSGSATAAGVGGVLPLVPSDGSVADDDEAYIGTTLSLFKPAINKPLYCEALVQFTEANTNAANVAFGLASSVGANLIVDDGGGMRASGTVVALYKVDGETVWRFVTRNGSAVTVTQSTTSAGGAAYQRLGIEIVDAGPNMAPYCVPTVDGNHLRDAATNQVIRHALDLTTIAAASLFAGVKNGSANLETLNVDYLAAVQVR